MSQELVYETDPLQFTCEHRHNGYEHPACFRKALPESFGFLDIETCNNFAADFGSMLSWCLKFYGKEYYWGDVLKKSDYEMNCDRDKRIVTSLVTSLNKLSLLKVPFTIVTFYGDDYRFDMPFARSRALIYGLQFPTYGTLCSIDMYPIAKKKLKLHNGRLESIQEAFHLKPEKTRIDIKHWQLATFGYNEESLGYIYDHNVKDTAILEAVFELLRPYVKLSKKSV